MIEGQNDASEESSADDEPGQARALTIHLLRMIETRMDAAGLALQGELHSFSSRLQLRLAAAAFLFIALWGGIVLLAIALPPHLRIPVLAVVIAAFVLAGVWAYLAANRKLASRDVGSLSWFLEGLKLDVEVVTRSLGQSRARQSTPPAEAADEPPRGDQNDLAA